jgi:hypothetical protein
MATCKWCGNVATHRVKHRYSPEEQAEVAAYHDSFKDGFHTGHMRTELLVLPGTMIDLCDEHVKVFSGSGQEVVEAVRET